MLIESALEIYIICAPLFDVSSSCFSLGIVHLVREQNFPKN